MFTNQSRTRRRRRSLIDRCEQSERAKRWMWAAKQEIDWRLSSDALICITQEAANVCEFNWAERQQWVNWISQEGQFYHVESKHKSAHPSDCHSERRARWFASICASQVELLRFHWSTSAEASPSGRTWSIALFSLLLRPEAAQRTSSTSCWAPIHQFLFALFASIQILSREQRLRVSKRCYFATICA